MEAVGRASSHCLAAGHLTVARTCREVAQAAPGYRALGSGSDPHARVGSTHTIWQWQQQGMCIPRRVGATMSGTRLQCPPPHWSLRWLGLQVVPVHGPPSGGRPRPPLESEMTVVVYAQPIAHTSDCQRRPTTESPHVCRKRYSCGSLPLLLSPSPTMVPCFSCGPRPPRFPQLWLSAPQPVVYHSLAPQAVSTQPTLVLSPELTSRAWVSVPSTLLSYGDQGSGTDGLCGSLSALPSSIQLLCFFSELWGLSILADLPISLVASQGVGSFPLSQCPLRIAHPILIRFPNHHPFSLSLFFFCTMWRVPCTFCRFKVFCQRSVDTLCEWFYM